MMRLLLVLPILLCSLAAGEAAPLRHDLADQPPAPTPAPWALRQGTFSVPSRMFGNPSVGCFWVRPEDASAPRAQDVVVYVPHPDDLGFAELAKGSAGTLFHQLARICGFTVLGLRIQGQGKDAVSHLDPADAQRTYLDPGNGYGDALAEALKHLRGELGLPERKVFACGLSGGGILGQRLGERRSDLVEGVVSLGGQSFWSTLKPQGAYLFGWTCGDDITEANLGAGVFYRRQDAPVILASTLPEWGRRGKPAHLFTHCIDAQGQRLAFRYLEGLSDLRRARGKLPLTAAGWPVVSSLRLHATAYERPTADAVVPIDAADAVAFPSLACWAEWARIPGDPLAIGVGGQPAHLALPAGAPAALVLFRRGRWTDADLKLWSRNDPLNEHPEWDVRQLAAAGVAALHLDADGPGLAVAATAGQALLLSHPPLGVCLHAPTDAELRTLPALSGLRAVCLVLARSAPQEVLAETITSLRQHGIAVQVQLERQTTDAKGRGEAIEALAKPVRGLPDLVIAEVPVEGRSLGDRLAQELGRAGPWLAQQCQARPAAGTYSK